MRDYKKLLEMGANGKIHFPLFLDTLGLEKRKKGSGNRKNDKKCLEMGENDNSHFLPPKPGQLKAGLGLVITMMMALLMAMLMIKNLWSMCLLITEAGTGFEL